MEGRFRSFAGALASDLGTVKGTVKPHILYAVKRQGERFRKKFPSSENSTLGTKAISEFLELNKELDGFLISLDASILFWAKEFISKAFQSYTSYLNPDLVQDCFDFESLYDRWRFGPGASHQVKGSHIVDKISQPMTVTDSAEPLVVQLRRQHAYLSSFDAIEGKPTLLVQGSKMSFVPKNEEKARTIAIEPSGNMALQLALGSYVEDVLRHIGLDIRSQQSRNRELARLGSLTSKLATLDLSSASDRISVSLCKALLPKRVFLLMMRIRSSHTLIDGVYHKLNMMSTMGNGFTFPIMTLLILSLCYATARSLGGPLNYVDYRFIGVFGDDIVVPTHIARPLIYVLNSAGLHVNVQKSYLEGPFRESCGGDYYHGEDVTPFYVKSLATDADVYVAINQVLRWSGDKNLVLDQTLVLLRSFIKGPLLFVPEWHNDSEGVLCTQVRRRYKYLQRSVKKRRVLLEHFVFPLACGGYIDGWRDIATYTPRFGKAKFKVAKSRLPNGYLDGRCTERYTSQVSAHISSWLFLLRTA